MQIVIDIPKSMYDDVIKGMRWDDDVLSKAIEEGTPLPKGHGELIDRGQALNECYNITVDGERFKVVQYETLLGVPTIIEADAESDEEPKTDWMYAIFNQDEIKAKKEQWTKEAEKFGMTLLEYLESKEKLSWLGKNCKDCGNEKCKKLGTLPEGYDCALWQSESEDEK